LKIYAIIRTDSLKAGCSNFYKPHIGGGTVFTMKSRFLSFILSLILCISPVLMTGCKKEKPTDTPEAPSTGNDEQSEMPSPSTTHTHLFSTWVDEVKATCRKTGTKAYKECKTCKIKCDSDGREITDTVIPKDSSNHAKSTFDAEPNGDGTHNLYYSCCGELYEENIPCTSEITYNNCTRAEYCTCMTETKEASASHTLAPKPGDDGKLECTAPGCDHEEDVP